MISPKLLIKELIKNKIKFISGVPDSVLKNLTNLIEKKKFLHIKAVNEGGAISACIGNFLATKNIGCAYLQNSGLSNAINPLISIADKNIYSIPILLIIGWRGAPGTKDEVQHKLKGEITKKILSLLKIKYLVISSNKDLQKISKLLKYSASKNKPVAVLIKNKTIEQEISNKKNKKKNNLSRIFFIKKLLKSIKKQTKIVSTTGYTSRELFYLRENYTKLKGKDFYMVGGMGHSSMVSLGISINNQDVICLDGDGSMLMHMGSLRSIGFYNPKKFKHILLNNFCHESVGGQETMSKGIDFKKVIDAFGYKNYFSIKNKESTNLILKKFLNCKGPSLLEVFIDSGSIKDLIRPKDFVKIKNRFMK